MQCRLLPASPAHRPWLEQLRRSVYHDLFVATFGGWDEARHRRHAEGCWDHGHIFLVEVDGVRVGMIQVLEPTGGIHIGELQIHPSHQNEGIGSFLLHAITSRAHAEDKPVVLSVGLKNDRAYRFYLRHGFRQVSQTATHRTMINEAPDEAGGGPACPTEAR
jgi:ribosomal protein S18 acetylase RimI-like enzyme